MGQCKAMSTGWRIATGWRKRGGGMNKQNDAEQLGELNYLFAIHSDKGSESTMVGKCTKEQYIRAIAAFNGESQKPWVKPHEWRGLTDDELNMLGDRMKTWNSTSLKDIYTAIEAKLREKNSL